MSPLDLIELAGLRGQSHCEEPHRVKQPVARGLHVELHQRVLHQLAQGRQHVAARQLAPRANRGDGPKRKAGGEGRQPAQKETGAR